MENFVTWYKFTFAVNAVLDLSKFNVSDLSAMFFFSTYVLKTWFRLSRVKLCRNGLKGNKNYFEFAGGSSYRG